MATAAERQRKQKELDSILDAALDELDDSDSDSDDDGGGRNQTIPAGVVDDGDVAAATARRSGDASVGVPYSLEYLGNGEDRETGSSEEAISTRPQFGPEPPPSPMMPPLPPDAGLPPMPPLDLGPGGEAELAASLEGMMKQFTDQLAVGGGDSEKTLDDMFRKMMMGEMASAAAAGSGGNAESQSRNESKSDDDNNGNASPSPANQTINKSSSPANQTGNESKSCATPRKSNHRSTNNTNDNKNEPNVDESINRLLDGINHASNAPLPNPTSPAPPGMTMPPNPDDVDPAQFEKLGEQMMNSIMGEFEKMGNANDSNDVVDGVMKQLLDKDLMYEPMKEVCSRFPKWLAENKEELDDKEYERYGTQYGYFQKIVRAYETEPDNFARLMELMQDIQEYGQPPVDIIKDLAPELEFDEEGMPIMDPTGGGGMMPGMIPGMPGGMPFPGGGEQCCIS